MQALTFLQNSVNKDMPLTDIIDCFEEMCKIPVTSAPDEELLFLETGIFDFSDGDMFYFSLVRQYPEEDDEYYQIHLDVKYNPSAELEDFSETVWSDDEEVNGDFFGYIKNSKFLNKVIDKKIADIDIYLDQT